MSNIEQTLSIIKPDAVERNLENEIKEIFKQNGFSILKEKKIQIEKSEAEKFYKVHETKPFYNDLCEYLSSGPIVVMILQKENAVKGNRELMGATNPKDAEDGTIRKKYGISIDKNIDIILLTQGLPDHCHVPTLEMFRKDIPLICPKSAVKTLKKIGFSSIKMLKPTEKTNLFNLSFEATAGAPVPQIENGYIVKDNQNNGFYIEPHGYLDENLNNQNLDAVITPTKNLELPIVGSFVKGADVIPKLINKFNPKFILSSTVGGDAKYSGFLNNFISVKDYKEELNCNLVDLKSMQSIMI